MRKRQKIYDRTLDLKRLINSLQSEVRVSASDEVSVNVCQGSSKYGCLSTHLRSSAEELARSIEQSLLMIGELHAILSSNLLNEASDESSKLINLLTQRVSLHKKELENISEQIKRCGFSPNKQIFHHYEAVKTTLRTRVMDVSKIFKNALTHQIAIISNRVSSSECVSRDNEMVEHGHQYACENISEKLPTRLPQAQVQEIEQAVLGLTEMMQEVAHLVTEQEGLVKQIDFNVDMSMQEVMIGNLSLSGFSDAFRSRQRLIIRILFVVFVSIMLIFGMGIL